VTLRLSREKINFLSRIMLDYLFGNDQVEFLDDPNEIRLSRVKSIEEEIKLYNTIDKKAIEKIQSQKKAIEEGLPYQTLISSILHKFVSGRLIEKTS